MRPALLITTALTGVLVAIGFIVMMQHQPEAQPDVASGPGTTGRSPAFHLDATAEQRRSILEATFPRVASERAEKLGGLKDDLALLIDNPVAVQWIVAQWRVHKVEGRYAEAAFADLFRLVKDAAFVEPTADLLRSPLPEIRGKAVQSAQTQGSPALGALVLAYFRGVDAAPGSHKLEAKMEALVAGAACRGDAWPALVQEAVSDAESEIAVRALTLAADQDVAGIESAVRQALASSKDRRVRLWAAALLFRRGDPSASEEILRGLDPADPGMAAEALHLVAKYRITSAAARLRELRPRGTGELRPLFTLALLRTGDQDVMGEVLQAADQAGGPGELEALQVLAASGDENTAPVLLHALGRGGLERARAIARGISTSGQQGFVTVVEKLVEFPVTHPADLGGAPGIAGPALVPKLAKLLRGAGEPAAQVCYMSWLAQIGGTDARDVIVSERNRIGRLADEQLRLIDLEARRVGKPAPPLRLD